ncbi:MAG: DNA translocase FtsK [Anaerolineales bacterium]|nr:DNA translocase FtsK [Anaerolineales bacterium]
MTAKRSKNVRGHGTDGDSGTYRLDWSGLKRVLDQFGDVVMVILFAFCVITLLGLLGFTHGGLIDPWVEVLWRWLGWGALIIPLFIAWLGVEVFRRRSRNTASIDWRQVLSIEAAIIGWLGLLSVIDGTSLTRAEVGYGGGLVGWGISTVLADIAGPLGRTVLLVFLVGIASYRTLRGGIGSVSTWAVDRSQTTAPLAGGILPQVPAEQGRESRGRQVQIPKAYRKNFQLPDIPSEGPVRPIARGEDLPAFDLLQGDSSIRVTSREINTTAGLIEKTLADFGLPARVVDFRTGPAITQYAVEPGFVTHSGPEGGEERRSKVRVSQISALANDLALALSAPRLRIEAPVPGQAYIGIEVPNRKAALVRMRPLLESKGFLQQGSSLAIALGRDVAGNAVAADLAAMPHLLIAGTTGSGKSVCIAALATCLAMNNSPDDLRMVMIDPKMVELIRFNGLPHLFGKVETELERIVGVLRWCTVEMDNRYRLLEEAKARDIDMYNQKARRSASLHVLPRVVVMIDELADLMMLAPDQTEHTLVRLAQMARAVGIHLVVATQRPSTDILTGLIKANFPARISFAVASGVDSRVILDTPGAETLLGRGDMLYLSPEAGTPLRLQAVFVDDDEIEKVIQFWTTRHAGAESNREAPWEHLLSRKAAVGDRDDVLERAVDLVRQAQEASASMLQRRLRIGYPRAARLMDELEELGVIGRSQSGGRTREVLIGPDDDPFENLSSEDGDKDLS